jgi:hypothetical protein
LGLIAGKLVRKFGGSVKVARFALASRAGEVS